MKNLLDVSALVALVHPSHSMHARAHAWVGGHPSLELATCAITDLGLIRISMMLYSMNCLMAEKLLADIKRQASLGYVLEMEELRLPAWVLSHKQTTDAYLCQLAAANGMKLATLDAGIKDRAAYLIP